jgi:hypothetical protein
MELIRTRIEFSSISKPRSSSPRLVFNATNFYEHKGATTSRQIDFCADVESGQIIIIAGFNIDQLPALNEMFQNRSARKAVKDYIRKHLDAYKLLNPKTVSSRKKTITINVGD